MSQPRQVFYIEGEPRWEYKFIRRAADSDRSLRMASIVKTTQAKFYRQGVVSPAELADGIGLADLLRATPQRPQRVHVRPVAFFTDSSLSPASAA